MSDLLQRLPELVVAHLRLSLLSLGLGAILSIPFGVFLTRRPKLESAAMAVASTIQTVPALALLAFMVPVLAWLATGSEAALGLGFSSIGYLPAATALTLYSVLPMLRNTVTGINGVDPALVEAARGVGMTGSQRLWQVELPQALPVIVAGVRTATVWVVGMATLGTPVGAKSLGDYIFQGLQTRNYDAVMVGVVASAALALLLDNLIRLVELGISTRRRALWLSSSSAVGAITATALLFGVFQGGGEGRHVRIGAKPFTESLILAELIGAVLERETNASVTILSSLGSTVAYDGVLSGEIDGYVDYSGTIWTTVMKRQDRPPRDALYGQVKAYINDAGAQVIGRLGFENTYAVALKRDKAEALGVTSISDLAVKRATLSLGTDYEFPGREEFEILKGVYGLEFDEVRPMESTLMYEAIKADEVDVITAYSTDGRIKAYALTTLDDDKNAIPPYDAILLTSAALLEGLDGARAALDALVEAIDAETMRALNFEVDERKRSAAEVAREFLANDLALPDEDR